jgi:hypothetical protein
MNPGDSTYGTSPEPAGTYAVTVGLTGSGTGYNLVLYDSNGIPECLDVTSGGAYVFTGKVMNSSTTVYIILSNGACI